MRKLLTPVEIESVKAAEIANDIRRAKQTKTVLDEAERQLRDVEAKFEVTLTRQRAQYAKMEEEALGKIKALKKEVEELEERKRLATIPIDDLKKKAHDTLIEADRIKAESEELRELLESKLDALSDREVDLAYRESKAMLERQSLDEERKAIQRFTATLSNKLFNSNESNRSNKS